MKHGTSLPNLVHHSSCHSLVLVMLIFLHCCSMFPKSTHETFSTKLFRNLGSHSRLEKTKFSETDFTISHYAGKACPLFCFCALCHIFFKSCFYGLIVCVRAHGVGLPWSCYYKLVHMSHSPRTLFFSWSAHRSKTLFIYHVWLLLMIAFLDFWIVQVIYQTNSFLEKNRDYVVFEHCNLLSLSKCTFVASLFPPQESSKSNYKFSSVATRFKVLIFPFVDSHNMA